MKSLSMNFSSQQWSSYLRKACHDVRAPLAVLQGYSEIVQKQASEEMSKKLSLQGLRSVFEVDIFLHVLAFRERGVDLNLEENSWDIIIKKTTAWCHQQFPGIIITGNSQENQTPIIADQKKLTQALIALVVKCIDEHDKIKHFQIRCFNQKQSLCISVEPSVTLPPIENNTEISFMTLFIYEVVTAHRGKIRTQNDGKKYYTEICLPLPIIT